MREDESAGCRCCYRALVALALAVIPAARDVDALRPDFLVLVVFYWSIESPQRRRAHIRLLLRARARRDQRRGVGPACARVDA